jgi:hypothetical protein
MNSRERWETVVRELLIVCNEKESPLEGNRTVLNLLKCRQYIGIQDVGAEDVVPDVHGTGVCRYFVHDRSVGLEDRIVVLDGFDAIALKQLANGGPFSDSEVSQDLEYPYLRIANRPVDVIRHQLYRIVLGQPYDVHLSSSVSIVLENILRISCRSTLEAGHGRRRLHLYSVRGVLPSVSICVGAFPGGYRSVHQGRCRELRFRHQNPGTMR